MSLDKRLSCTDLTSLNEGVVRISFGTPILFLVFNRPDTTHRVFEVIRNARPERLYLAADGARTSRKGETERVNEVRQIISLIDWPCEVKTLFRETNLGCKKAVSSAISWFFEHEPEGIVLEDDCVPHPQFFSFCAELLERYRDDERIGIISGTSLYDIYKEQLNWDKEDYIFSRYLSIWGWASWRRVWKDYDPDITCWPIHEKTISELTENARVRSSHKALFDKIHKGEIDTWDYQVSFMLWTTGRVAVTPRFNLIENIGFNFEATHTKSSSTVMAQLSRMSNENLTFPLTPPRVMIRNRSYEKKLEKLATRSILHKILERLASYAS